MKNIIVTIALLMGAAAGSVRADDTAGSNPTGTEKVCSLGVTSQTEQGLNDALKACRRGDILDIGWLQTTIAMQLCDFTKAVIYHPAKGSVIACVFTGSRRNVSR